jgi:hypothetical protein
MGRVIVLALVVATFAPGGAQPPAVSNKPDTPFKLATFESGKLRLGLVLGNRVLDIHDANAELMRKAGVPAHRSCSPSRR